MLAAYTDEFSNESFIDCLKKYNCSSTDWKEKYQQNKMLVDALKAETNTFGFIPDNMIEKAKSNRLMTKLTDFCNAWVLLWADAEPYRTDDRNRIATEICRDIRDFVPAAAKDKFKEIETEIFAMHRTLAQSTMNLVIKVLCEKNSKVKTYIDRRYCGNFRRLPMI